MGTSTPLGLVDFFGKQTSRARLFREIPCPLLVVGNHKLNTSVSNAPTERLTRVYLRLFTGSQNKTPPMFRFHPLPFPTATRLSDSRRQFGGRKILPIGEGQQVLCFAGAGIFSVQEALRLGLVHGEGPKGDLQQGSLYFPFWWF